MGNRNDLNHTADGLRDLAGNLSKEPDEQKIQASMLEEIAVAQHRTAEAIEELTRAVERLDNH